MEWMGPLFQFHGMSIDCVVLAHSLLRVSYDYFYNREDAILALNKIKLENPRAWLLTK